MDIYTSVTREIITSKNAEPNFVYQKVTYSHGHRQTVYTKRSISDQLRKGDGEITSLLQHYKYQGKNPIKDSHGSGLIVT